MWRSERIPIKLGDNIRKTIFLDNISYFIYEFICSSLRNKRITMTREKVDRYTNQLIFPGIVYFARPPVGLSLVGNVIQCL